jgi:DNA-binding SARP family transcriptional activator/predicted ATPase
LFLRRMYVFGSLRVQDARGLRHLSGERVQSLLVFLTLHPRIPHRREVLADLLSPDAPPERVRRNFSDTVYRLKKALSPEWLLVDADAIALNAGAELWVDAWEFERLAGSQQVEDLQQAVNLYTGDLAPEIYAEWIESERALYRSQYIAALEMLAKSSEARGKLQQALLHTRRILQADPLHEPAHQAYLRLLGRLKRYGEALAHYDDLRQLMRSELNAEPLAETRAIIQSIEHERVLAAGPINTEEEHSAFIGRISERATALAAVEAALEGRGGLLAIEGEAGVGKSRFLREILAGASWRGATILHGVASQVPGASPFSPLVEALDPLLNGARAAHLETILPPEILATLAPLFPAWRERAGQAIRTGTHFHDALRYFGETLARLAPLVLALDDLHWADPALWESINALSQGLAHNGALLLLVYRRREVENTPGWRILQAWDRAGLLRTIDLQPFSLPEVAQLVGDQPGADPEKIFSFTGGNAFLVNEWLADPALSRSRSDSTIAQRLEGLSAPARAALQAAAVLGENFSYRHWVKTANLSPLALADQSEELVQRRWLQTTPQGYSFVHDLIRTAVYENLKPADRQALHERAARAFLELEPDNARARAFHYDQAGRATEAALAYRRAGEQDQERFAFHEAQAAFERALDLMSRAPTLERIETDIALARVCEITGARPPQGPALDEALEGARQLGNEALMLQALLVMGRASSRMGKFLAAETQLSTALTLSQKLRDHPRETEAIIYMGDLSGMQGRWEAARGCYYQALSLAQAVPDPAREANALRGIAIAARFMGDMQEAARRLEQSVVVNRQIGDRLGEIIAQVNIVSILYESCAWDRLIAVTDQAIPAAEAMGNLSSLIRLRQNRGLAAWALGDYATARTLLLQAERGSEFSGDTRLTAIARNCLGLVAEDEGNLTEALHLYRTSLVLAEGLHAATEIAYVRHDLGALLLRLGQPAEAIPHLEASRAVWSEHGSQLLRVKSEAFLGLALLAAGDRAGAEELADRAWAAFQQGVPVGELPQGWLWALYRLFVSLDRTDPARQVLRAAFEELQRQALEIKNPDRRSGFLERVPLNHAIMAAYEQNATSTRVVSVSLARRDAPLGRALKGDERITVHWTVSALEDESVSDKTLLRRQRLKRLLQQAESQGAAPTDDDLAGVLGVSRRTILRDLQALSDEIKTPSTRKRKR